MYRIRTRFSKMDLMKFISHLDLMRMMERTLRRSKVPLAFTQGFNPHPKIAFATALAIGVTSEGEYMDIEITEKMDLDDFKSTMNKNLPSGIRIIQCKYIDLGIDALMAVIDYSTYVVKCSMNKKYDIETIESGINDFLSQDCILISKKSKKKNREVYKEVDIKPLIRSLEIMDLRSEELVLKLNLATGSKGNLKPEILISKFVDFTNLELDKDATRIHRLDLFVYEDGRLTTPMDIPT